MLTLCIAKIIMDFGLYFAYFAFFLSMGTFTVNVQAIFFMLVGIASMCCILRKAPVYVRLLPMLLLYFCFRNAHTVFDVILPIPGAIYIGIQAVKGTWMPSYGFINDNFKRFIGLYFVVLGFTIVGQIGSSLEKYSIPYITLWALMSVYLMRILRGDNEVLFSKKYQLINTLVIGGVGASAFLISSPTMLSAVKSSFLWVYSTFIAPLLMLVGYLFNGVLWCLIKLCTLLHFTKGELKTHEVELKIGSIEDYISKTTRRTLNLRWIFIIVGTILTVCVVIYFLKKLLRTGEEYRDASTKGIVRQKIYSSKDEEKHGLELFARGTSREKVRFYYRKYLQLCRKHNIPVDGTLTSEAIEKSSEDVVSPASAHTLRNVWLPARYSSSENVSEKDVIAAKEAYKKLKS